MTSKPGSSRSRIILPFVGAVFLCAILAHIFWAVLMAGYSQIQNDYRLPRVTALENLSDRMGMVSSFASEILKTKPDAEPAIISGGSFSYGYGIPGSDTYAMQLEKEMGGYKIANLAVMSMDPSGQKAWIYCPLKASGKRYALAIVEIPFVNHNSFLGNTPQSYTVDKFHTSRCRNPRRYYAENYLEYFLRRPHGLSWVSIVWHPKSPDPNSPYSQGNLPKTYIPDAKTYEAIKDYARKENQDMIAAFAEIADTVVVFTSPVYTPGLVKAGFSRANIERQIRDANTSCVPGANVICLGVPPYTEREDLFRDVVHFNANGHALFAQWLYERIKSRLTPVSNPQ